MKFHTISQVLFVYCCTHNAYKRTHIETRTKTVHTRKHTHTHTQIFAHFGFLYVSFIGLNFPACPFQARGDTTDAKRAPTCCFFFVTFILLFFRFIFAQTTCVVLVVCMTGEMGRHVCRRLTRVFNVASNNNI